MEIDLSPGKMWNDLIESKESLKYLLIIGLVLIVLGIIDVFLKVKILSSIGTLFLGGYFILMINNIIHERKPILEDLEKSQSKERGLGTVTLKNMGIGFIFAFCLLTIGIILFLLFVKLVMLNITQAIIVLIIFLLPLIVIVSLCHLLFAENLKFSDAFNIKKAIASFKIAWGKYLMVFGIYILLIVLVFTLLMIILVPLIMSLIMMLKNYPALILTKETTKLIGGILGSSFGEIGGIILSYWYYNAVAQVYKYSLTKMNITENQ